MLYLAFYLTGLSILPKGKIGKRNVQYLLKKRLHLKFFSIKFDRDTIKNSNNKNPDRHCSNDRKSVFDIKLLWGKSLP